MSGGRGGLRRAIATGSGVTVGAAAYLLTLLAFGRDLTRTAMGIGYASNFFDLQARAFLDGRIWVPRGTLGIEGFLVRGHEYMYFPPFPALLRIPVLFTTHEYDGRLTLLSMALAFVLMAVMTTRLVWLVRDLMYPDRPVGWLESASTAILIGLALGGTTLTFDASDPWVYHEVYAWAIPLVIGSMYWMLRVLHSALEGAPDPKAIAWLVVFDLATIMTRTTGGWAVCLVTIGIGAWLLTGRLGPHRRTGWWVLGGGAAALAAGIAYNWVKFRHPFLFPLEDQVWTSLNERRQEALEVNGGTITGPQFFTTSFVAYFRPDGIRFVDYFPWVTLPAEPARGRDGAFLDQSYRTGSVTAFMPWLLLMTTLATVHLFRPGVDAARRALRAPLVAGVLVTAGVMGYGYLAFRYTSEFVPALVLGGAIGTAVVNQWLGRRPRAVYAAGLVLMTASMVFSVGAQMLTGFSETATTARGPALQRYLALQQDLSSREQAGLVTFVDGLPRGGATDDIAIRGDCDAVYLNTGDDTQPWVPVEHRSLVFALTLDRDFTATSVKLGKLRSEEPGIIWLQTNNHGEARIVLDTDTGVFPGYWFDVKPPGVIRLGIRDDPDLGYAEVSSTPGGFVGYLRTFDYDESWIGSSVDVRAVTPRTRKMAAHGITLSVERGLDPPLCHRILSSVRAAGGPTR